MAAPLPRTVPIWFPLAALALLIAWPTADRVRAADTATQLLVADLRGDAIYLVDARSGEVATTLEVSGGAHELLELPDGRIVVSIEQTGRLALLDLERADVQELPIGGTPHGLALEDDATLLVTDRAVDRVRRFDLATWREVEPIEVARWPHAVAVSADGDLVVAAALGGVLQIGEAALPVSELPETVAVAPDGRIATAGAIGGVVHLFAPDGSEVSEIALGGRPVRVQFSPDGDHLAVALSAAHEVALVDRSGNVRRAPVRGVPDGVAFDPAGDRLYVSDVHNGGVTVLDLTDLEHLETIEVGVATGVILAR